jgi:hypothetical protein
VDIDLGDDDLIDAYLELEGLAEHELLTFVPSPALAKAMIDRHRWKVYRLPNRMGKTRHGAAEVAQQMIDEPGTRARAIGPTSRTTHRVQGRYLFHFLREHLAPGSYYIEGKGWNTDTIRLRNGSFCELKSVKDDPQTHAGDEFDVVWFDEVPLPAHWTENCNRVGSRRGRVLVTVTPVDRPTEFLQDDIEGPADSQARKDARSQEAECWAGARDYIQTTRWRTWVSEFTRASAPWKSEEEVEEQLEIFRSSPWSYDQRARGAWDGVTEGRVFRAFTDRNESAATPQGAALIGFSADHGEKAGRECVIFGAWQKGSAIEFGRRRDSYRVMILDEYVSADASGIDDDGREIVERLAALRWPAANLDLAVGDVNTAGKGYAGASVNEALEEAIAHELAVRAAAGRAPQKKTCPFRIVTPDKLQNDFGMRLINWMLRRVELTIHPRCVALLKSIKHWKGGGSGEDGELKHIADSLIYFIVKIVEDSADYQRLRFT